MINIFYNCFTGWFILVIFILILILSSDNFPLRPTWAWRWWRRAARRRWWGWRWRGRRGKGWGCRTCGRTSPTWQSRSRSGTSWRWPAGAGWRGRRPTAAWSPGGSARSRTPCSSSSGHSGGRQECLQPKSFKCISKETQNVPRRSPPRVYPWSSWCYSFFYLFFLNIYGLLMHFLC